MWNFETIDAAEQTDEASVFEMEPMNELLVGQDVQMRNLMKSCDKEDANIWYGQVSATYSHIIINYFFLKFLRPIQIIVLACCTMVYMLSCYHHKVIHI